MLTRTKPKSTGPVWQENTFLHVSFFTLRNSRASSSRCGVQFTRTCPVRYLTQTGAFVHQHYVRAPNVRASTVIMAHYERLATAIFPYLGRSQPLSTRDTLPKVLWLLQTLPADVPVLAPWTPWTRRYYDVLEANGVNISRILPFNLTSRAVVSVDDLYTTLEWPYCDHGENPNHGGEPSEYPYEIMDPLRASILPNR